MAVTSSQAASSFPTSAHASSRNTTNLLPNQFASQGYCVWPWRNDVFQWSQSLLVAANQALAKEENQSWWRHQHSWFVGVNVLPNDSLGAIEANFPIPLWLQQTLQNYCLGETLHLDQGQVSVCCAGYPRQDHDESDQSHDFRKQHFAAHLDGLIPTGDKKRRFLQEYHSFILGVPLTQHPAAAAPLMVWPGSHKRLQQWLQMQLMGIEPSDWHSIDLTQAYQLQRRAILADTIPIPLPAVAGQVYVLHRHMLHGMGAWHQDIHVKKQNDDGDKQRTIAYFRPEMHDKSGWLNSQ